ncbi:MAG: L-glutamate gamma-semialdehyde dehydrogenase [candidate division Zixibacteria bacterium]|nr:L-glutamate gamma-semialdehyde dehydrogenase [candidate division Zixibacteria bacterium]
MGFYNIPIPENEPVKSYAPGTSERADLIKALADLKARKLEAPMIIGGKEIKTNETVKMTCPHDHSYELGHYYRGGAKEIAMAIDAAMAAKETWENLPWEQRAAVFLKAADLLAGPYRAIMNAATMLSHGKNIFQAEIDAVCELADFFRFNAYYMQQIYSIQPNSSPQTWNYVDYRPLEGFVFAVTPFNFVSIAGNLPSAPAIMGNVALWKPASSCVYTAHLIMKILKEAGLPDGVINLITARGADVGNIIMKSEHLAGIHFTGSTAVFQSMWKTVGENIANYRSYPRIVGETGGKDFVFVHKSSSPIEVSTALVRGSFEYQGQKCSAASRAYIPESLWDDVKELLIKTVGELKMGSPEDFTNFINPVIDKSAFSDITSFIDYAIASKDCEIIVGGNYDDSKGYFIEPTIVVATDPHFKLMEEEIFGPVLTIFVYPDDDFEKMLHVCDETSPYALTGAIFSRDRVAVAKAGKILRQAAGNFYINDKPTGAVVGQQPFGGARASGTNDKAGSVLNMIRWTSPRTIKETLVSPTDYKYPFLAAGE